MKVLDITEAQKAKMDGYAPALKELAVGLMDYGTKFDEALVIIDNLVQHFGGTRIFIPRRFCGKARSGRVATAISVGALEALSQIMGGITLTVPKNATIQRRGRNNAIRGEYDSGEIGVEALARKYDLTTRQIYSILGRGHNE